MNKSEMYKLNDLAEFISGKNIHRLSSSLEEYSIQDFEYDYSHPYKMDKKFNLLNETDLIVPGDIIINLLTGKAAIAGEKSYKKVFSQNFSKIKLKKEFPPSYFLYLMNEEKSFQREKTIYSTGSVVKRLSNTGLAECSVKRFSLEEEKAIGNTYINALKVKSQAIEQAEKILAMNLGILNQYVNKK